MEKDSIEHLKTDLDRKGMIVPKQLLELSSVVGQGIIALLFTSCIRVSLYIQESQVWCIVAILTMPLAKNLLL